MSRDPDRLLELLPAYHRRSDAAEGEPLRALLGVLAEQVDLVEQGVEQLYDDWFIETCADWVVPYIGDLVGYHTLRGYTDALAAGDEQARRLAARLAPRRDVAGTVAARRRKGTLPLLENLAATVAGWPARAVEFAPLLAANQPVRLYPDAEDLVARRAHEARHRGYVDVRRGAALDLLGGPFEDVAHGVEAPRIISHRRQGRYNPPAVGLFAWRLRPFSVTNAPAYCIDRARNLFTFSILGNDAPLVTKPVPEPSADHIAAMDNVPAHVRRRQLEERLADYYGPGRSFAIWRDNQDEPVPLADIVVANLTDWTYRPRRNQVAVDPVLGRIAFASRSAPRRGVWVTYHYAFSDAMGGGEYPRERPTPRGARVYRVGPGEEFEHITGAYEQWRADSDDHGDGNGSRVPEAIIEITNSGAYQEQIEFVVEPGERLELRAAEGARPVIRLLDWYSNRPDALVIRANPAAEGDCRKRPRVVLDGLLVTGRGVSVSGPVGSLTLRHSTLVPGWSPDPECEPVQPEEPSLVLENTTACISVERSILGTIRVLTDEVHADPLAIHLADSILDATGSEREALSAPECRHAHAVLHVHRTTVIGEVHTHAVQIGEDTVFDGQMHVARRGTGCLRYCYVPPGSRTPRRHQCQPDLVWVAVGELVEDGEVEPGRAARLRDLEAARVRPRYTSARYGTPAYCQLGDDCAVEITRGAADGSEMGAFHDLFQPQREDNLRARLAEFSPAGTDAGIVYVT